jgi:hypothetical protein
MKLRYKVGACGVVGVFAFAGINSESTSSEDTAHFGQALTEETNEAFALRRAFELGRFKAPVSRYVSKFGAHHGDVGRLVDSVSGTAGWSPAETPEQAKIAACSTALISLNMAGAKVSPESVALYNTAGQELAAADHCVHDTEQAILEGVISNLQLLRP